METIRIAITKWYKCPFCWKYSFEPRACCGVEMIEIEEDYTEKILNE